MITCDAPLPPALVDLIKVLIQRPDVQSVSFPLQDEEVWRQLVAVQIARARQTGRHLQHAFGLSGPDAGLPFDTAAWGGYVHIPYEGMLGGDLIVKPHWRRCNLQAAMGQGDLGQAIGLECQHLLLEGLHMEVDSAVRSTVDGWTLYTANGPYVPCNPFLEDTFDPNEPLPSPWAEPF